MTRLNVRLKEKIINKYSNIRVEVSKTGKYEKGDVNVIYTGKSLQLQERTTVP